MNYTIKEGGQLDGLRKAVAAAMDQVSEIHQVGTAVALAKAAESAFNQIEHTGVLRNGVKPLVGLVAPTIPASFTPPQCLDWTIEPPDVVLIIEE